MHFRVNNDRILREKVEHQLLYYAFDRIGKVGAICESNNTQRQNIVLY